MICSITERRMRSSELECHLPFWELFPSLFFEADFESADLGCEPPPIFFLADADDAACLLLAPAASLASLVARLGRVMSGQMTC